MQKEQIEIKMIKFYQGNIPDINHFLKVYAFASLIGKQEGLDTDTQDILEIAALIHDIACPLCREKYGDTDGRHQEAESETLAQDFLEEFHLPPSMLERIVFLVTHHHTYSQVDGMDYQILLEADYLVNAGVSDRYACRMEQFRQRVFRTKTGIELLDSMYRLSQ